jgi:putative DNA primase/helicase
MSSDPSIKALEQTIKNLEKRAGFLRTRTGRYNCNDFNKTGPHALKIIGDNMDQKPWLFGVGNGVIHLRPGELKPGRQEQLLMKTSNIECPSNIIDAPDPEAFLKFLSEIFPDNPAIKDYLRRVFGYCLIGAQIEHVIFILSGPNGRNGKSLLMKTILKVMGQLAGPIRAEMLMDQGRSANPSGPTPEIASIIGKRLICASEAKQGSGFSLEKIKLYTGGDMVVFRGPHEKHERTAMQTHTLFLITNDHPHASADDRAFWARVHLIPFNQSFVDRKPENENEHKADPNLSEKLEKELPLILAWMVRGCLEYQRVGLKPPAVVKAAVEEYRRDEDQLADFIEECCIEGEFLRVGATQAYEAFKEWWRNNVHNRPFSQKKFGTLFQKRYEKRKGQTVSYYGVGLRDA